MLYNRPDMSRRIDALGRVAIVAGHPGHELKIYGWMHYCKPLFCVLTDGSGHKGISRIASTERLARKLDARIGPIFGVISDQEIYRAILDQQTCVFLEILDSLTAALLESEIDCVAADASEGFNPTHDICRVLVNAAVLMAGRASGKNVLNYEFQLTGWERNSAERHDDSCLHLTLDESLLQRKFQAAEEYCELKEEIERSVTHHGRAYFQTECLRKAQTQVQGSSGAKPFYETWGEKQVAAGRYESVIRFHEHMAPLMKEIERHAEAAQPANVRSFQRLGR